MLHTILTTEIVYALGCMFFILSGVFCAVVRWCHMCRPFDQKGDYFYPAHRQATLFFSAVALQFPYVLAPLDTDVIALQEECSTYPYFGSSSRGSSLSQAITG